MGKPEAHVEGYLRQRVKDEGGTARKLVFQGRSGAPDQLIWFPQRQPIFVECKRVGGKVDGKSPQGREIARMRADGLRAFTVASRDEVDDIIKIAKHA